MLENVNIDSIMKKYYHGICSDKLSEDKINIDENLEVENSSTKYLQLFASFLNESYYKGYVLSNSIMKKLMDIIDYEGFEYQILEKYIDILNNAMNDYKCDEDNRPTYREIILESEESKNFVMEYLKVLNDEKFVYSSLEVPHFKNPESSKEDKLFDLIMLREIDYPIDIMYKAIINGDYSYNFYIENMKVIYDENISAYKSLIKNNTSSLFFLLNYDNNRALDILVDNVTSLPMLANLIKRYENYLANNDTNHVKYKFDTIVNNNIRRLIEILTINVSIEQTAMIIGMDYNLWKSYCDENYHELHTLLYAVNLYQSDPDRFKMLNSLDFIFKIKEYYINDVYFYARTALLSMDYNIFCNNFIDIFEELYKYIDESTLVKLFNECIDGLIFLRNGNVDKALINLSNNLTKLYYKDNKNTMIKYNGKELITDIINTDKKDIIIKCFALFNIKNKLLHRNGYFDINLVPSEYDDVQVDYKYFEIDNSLIENIIFTDDNNKITIGSKIIDVRNIQSMNPYLNLYYKYFDAQFRICDKDSALYTAIYIDMPDSEITNTYPDFNNNIDLLLIHGDDNKKLKLSSVYKGSGTYLLGIITTDNSFIYGDLLINKEDNSVVSKLYDYYLQEKNCIITAGEEALIIASREDLNTYVSGISNDKYTNYKLIFTEEYNTDNDKIPVVLI